MNWRSRRTEGNNDPMNLDDDNTAAVPEQSEAPARRRGVVWARWIIVAACLIGLAVRFARLDPLDPGEEYAARYAMPGTLARFGFVRAELARDAGDKQAAAALEKLADEHDSTGILEWLRSVADAEPQNIEVRREIVNLGQLHKRLGDSETALRQILALKPDDMEAINALACLLERTARPRDVQLLGDPPLPVSEWRGDSCDDCTYLLSDCFFGFKDNFPPHTFADIDTPWDYTDDLVGKVRRSGRLGELARLHFRIGAEFHAEDFPSAALENYGESVELYEKLGNTEFLAQLHFLRSKIYIKLEMFDEAEDSLDRCIALFQILGSPRDVAQNEWQRSDISGWNRFIEAMRLKLGI